MTECVGEEAVVSLISFGGEHIAIYEITSLPLDVAVWNTAWACEGTSNHTACYAVLLTYVAGHCMGSAEGS